MIHIFIHLHLYILCESCICIHKYTILINVINVYCYYKYPSLIMKLGLETEIDCKNDYKFLASLHVHTSLACYILCYSSYQGESISPLLDS